MNNVVAIYIRVSTKEQALDGFSLSAQERILLEYCKARKYKVYKIYADEGISAKDIVNRPGIQLLLSDAKQGKFNAILVWKLTRFSRNMTDLMSICEVLDRLGVSLISYSESFDSATPAGRMVRSMLGSVAQFEREVISENVSMELFERAKQGKITCWSILGYDLCGKDSYRINPVEAKYVNFVHDTYLIQKSITEVANIAVKNGYRGKRGRPPKHSSILVILTRPQYAGYNHFNGKLYKGDFESIRTPKEFNRVQRLLLEQGKATGKPRKTNLYIVPE